VADKLPTLLSTHTNKRPLSTTQRIPLRNPLTEKTFGDVLDHETEPARRERPLAITEPPTQDRITRASEVTTLETHNPLFR
jgi:hypothetical protein